MSEAFWQFFTADGKQIGVFPTGFRVDRYVFLLVMSAHYCAWQLPYMRN